MLHLNNTRKFFKLNSLNFLKRHSSAHKWFESEAATVSNVSGIGEEISEETSSKLPSRLPLAKNFFVGLVDKELLGFPEVISRDNLAELKNDLLPVQNFFSEDFESHKGDATQTFPINLAENLKQLNLYGTNVSTEFNGKGWGFSESILAQEPESGHTELSLSLLGHRSVIDAIQEFGTTEQKQKFLTKLANGYLVASEAIYEFEPSENDIFHTKAHQDTDLQCWLLNGGKAFVVSPPRTEDASQLFLVIAETQKSGAQDEANRATTLFLLEANTPGVELGAKHQSFGCRATTTQEISFKNVRLPNNCVLGNPHEGNIVATSLLRASRLRGSMINLGLAKKIFNEMSHYCIEKRLSGFPIIDMESIQTCLAKSYLALYGIESMIYMTAGLLDEFNKPDVALESAITKYYSLKELLNICITSLDIIGPKSLHPGHTTETYFRDTAQLYTLGESIDNMSVEIALLGLQHAGNLTADNIRKQRNPLFNPGHIFSKIMERSSIDFPRTHMDLKEHVHPTLEPSSLCIEHSVARLQMCVDLLLTRYGNSIVERHNEARRLADIVTVIYVMFCSVSRASRSYCIGLPLADKEILTAVSICTNGRSKVKRLTEDIFHGKYMNNDNNFERLSGQIVKSKEYFATHPLTYNF